MIKDPITINRNMRIIKDKINVVLPVFIKDKKHIPMTLKCIELMKRTSVNYELVIVETESNYFNEYADIYLYEKIKENPNRSINRAFNVCDGEFIVFIANDVFVCEDWLEYMLDCFSSKDDCGIASLGISEHKDSIKNEIVESLCFSVCMMKNEDAWFDPEYKVVFDDTDLAFRLHIEGKKFYKNLNGYAVHNPHTTIGEFGGDINEFNRSREYFINKYIKYNDNSLYQVFSGV